METLGLCVREANSFCDFVLINFLWAFLHEDLDLSVVYVYMYFNVEDRISKFFISLAKHSRSLFFACAYHFSGCLSVK